MLNGTLPEATSNRDYTFQGQRKAGWRRAYLRALATTGQHGLSARTAGVHPAWVCRCKQRNARFARACNRAMALAVRSKVEIADDTVYSLGVDGETRTTYAKDGSRTVVQVRSIKALELWLKAHNRSRYDRPKSNSGNTTVNIVHDHSTTNQVLANPELARLHCQIAAIRTRPTLSLPSPSEGQSSPPE